MVCEIFFVGEGLGRVLLCIRRGDVIARGELRGIAGDVVTEAEEGEVLGLGFEHDVGREVCNGAEKGDRFERIVVVGMTGPDGWLEDGLDLVGLAVAAFEFTELGAGAGEMDLGADARWARF